MEFGPDRLLFADEEVGSSGLIKSRTKYRILFRVRAVLLRSSSFMKIFESIGVGLRIL